MSFNPFANKDAIAILTRVSKGKSLAPLKKTLTTAAKESWIDSSKLCDQCLAIGELIAIGRGNAGKIDLPTVAEAWLDRVSPEFDDELAALALQAVEKVRSKSVSWAIAEDMGGWPAWTGYCRGLVTRLKKPPKKARKKIKAGVRKKSAPAKNDTSVTKADAIKILTEKLCRIEKEKGEVVELICFEKNQLNDEHMKCIAQLKKLRFLSLVSQAVTDDGLAELSNLKSLRALNVSHCKVKGKGFAALKLPGLRELSFGKSGVDIAIANCKHLTGIREFDLRDSDLTDAGLAKMAQFKSLETIWIDQCGKVTGAGFAKLNSLKKLTEILAGEIKFSPAGWKALCANTKLRKLELGSSRIPLKEIAQIEKLSGLQELELAKTKVTDKQLGFLAGMRKLKILDLSGNPGVTDQTVELICKLPALEELSLSRTSVTDDAVPALLKMKKLNDISVSFTKVSATNEKKLDRHAAKNA